jgi:hypothetical protein
MYILCFEVMSHYRIQQAVKEITLIIIGHHCQIHRMKLYGIVCLYGKIQ